MEEGAKRPLLQARAGAGSGVAGQDDVAAPEASVMGDVPA